MGQIKLFAAYNKAAKTCLVLPRMALHWDKKKSTKLYLLNKAIQFLKWD